MSGGRTCGIERQSNGSQLVWVLRNGKWEQAGYYQNEGSFMNVYSLSEQFLGQVQRLTEVCKILEENRVTP
jgi:hypothetical protein